MPAVFVSIVKVMVYVSAGLLFVILMIGFGAFRRERARASLRERIARQWGEARTVNPPGDRLRAFEAEFVRDAAIDQKTWNDLDMDAVVAALDHCETYIGSAVLKKLLRSQSLIPSEVAEQFQIIEQIRKDPWEAKTIKTALGQIGRHMHGSLDLYLRDGLTVTQRASMYRYPVIAQVIAIALFFFRPAAGLSLFVLFTLLNSWLNYQIKIEVDAHTNTFREVARILASAAEIANMSAETLSPQANRLIDALYDVDPLREAVSGYRFTEGLPFELKALADLISQAFLIDARRYFRAADAMNRYREEFIRLLEAYGEIDAIIGTASVLESGKIHCAAHFEGGAYRFRGLYHPLLAAPVPYDLELPEGRMLLTGSNASGKSTFLKACGISQIFAQTFGFAFAEELCTDFYQIASSMNSADDITRGDSYFMAEAKGLLRILGQLDSCAEGIVELPSLVITDELFRGTNTVERVSAAVSFLRHIAGYRCVVLAATHDMELVPLLSPEYEMYHFSERVTEDDIEFDYRLRKGPTTSTNALAILRVLGYPASLYQDALRIAQRIGSTNRIADPGVSEPVNSH